MISSQFKGISLENQFKINNFIFFDVYKLYSIDFIFQKEKNIKMKTLLQKFNQESNFIRTVFAQFLVDEILNYASVCKQWQQKIYDILQLELNQFKSKFQNQYSQLFMIQQHSYFRPKIQMIIYKTPDTKKTNIDFLLNFYLKEKYQFEAKTKYTLSYSFQLKKSVRKKMLCSRKKAKKHFWKVQFQYIGDQSEQKDVWMYKDFRAKLNFQSDNQNLKSQLNMNAQSLPYIMDCQPIKKTQKLQLRLPYCVRNSIVDFQKFKFYTIQNQSTKLSTIEKFFSKKPITACYIQNLYEWKKYDYFLNPISFELDDAINSYKDELYLNQIYINNLEDHFKIEFKCKKSLKEAPFIGHLINIFSNSQKQNKRNQQKIQPIIQLKRKGIYQQKKKSINLKIGDRLTLYLCQTRQQ